MPLQHISDKMLSSMRRNSTQAGTLSLLEKIRTTIPEVSIRTSFIVGYPGETEQDFEELADFVQSFRFDRMGVFTYSQEEGTPAAGLKPHVSKRVKQERYNRLMELQQLISLERNMEKIGREMRVIVDSEESEHYVGRSQADAPEIDNEILIQKSAVLKPGTFARVTITDAVEYDLIAEPSTVQ
jgi:ribosomal protein S12 methylthiotransferase